MSEVLSKAERENIIAHAGLMAPHDYDGRALKAWVGDYEATVRQAEKCVEAALNTGTQLSRRLAKAEAERGKLQDEVYDLGGEVDSLRADLDGLRYELEARAS